LKCQENPGQKVTLLIFDPCLLMLPVCHLPLPVPSLLVLEVGCGNSAKLLSAARQLRSISYLYDRS